MPQKGVDSVWIFMVGAGGLGQGTIALHVTLRQTTIRRLWRDRRDVVKCENSLRDTKVLFIGWW